MKNKTIKTWGDRGDHNHMPGDDQSSTSRNLASRHQNLPKSFEVPQKSSSFYLHENFFMESWFFYWSIPHGNLKFNTALAPENGWVGWRTIRRLPFWGPVHFQGTCFNFKGGYQHGIPVASTLLNTSQLTSSRRLCAHRAEAVLDSGWRSKCSVQGKHD